MCQLNVSAGEMKVDHEKANGSAPRFVNPAVVARPESEVAGAKDATPRYIGQCCCILLLITCSSTELFREFLARHFSSSIEDRFIALAGRLTCTKMRHKYAVLQMSQTFKNFKNVNPRHCCPRFLVAVICMFLQFVLKPRCQRILWCGGHLTVL